MCIIIINECNDYQELFGIPRTYITIMGECEVCQEFLDYILLVLFISIKSIKNEGIIRDQV